jgi:hypothetical protein
MEVLLGPSPATFRDYVSELLEAFPARAAAHTGFDYQAWFDLHLPALGVDRLWFSQAPLGGHELGERVPVDRGA